MIKDSRRIIELLGLLGEFWVQPKNLNKSMVDLLTMLKENHQFLEEVSDEEFIESIKKDLENR